MKITYQKLFFLAKKTYPACSLKSILKRVRLVCLAMRHRSKLIDFQSRLAAINLSITPRMLGVVDWPYIHNGWTCQARLDAIAIHHELLFEKKPTLININSSNQLVVDLNEISKGVHVSIDKASWFSREGEFVVNLFKEDLRVASIALALGADKEQIVAYIGAVQGLHAGVPKQESLNIFKQLTKDFSGLRPKSLLLEIVKIIAKNMDVDRLLGIRDECRHHRHPYFKGEKTLSFKTDYNSFWKEHKGVLDKLDGFYQIPLTLNIKDLSTVVSKKRSQCRKRNEILASLSANMKI